MVLNKACNLASTVTHHAANMDEGGAFAGDPPFRERIRLHLKDARRLYRGEKSFNLLRHDISPGG